MARNFDVSPSGMGFDATIPVLVSIAAMIFSLVI